MLPKWKIVVLKGIKSLQPHHPTTFRYILCHLYTPPQKKKKGRGKTQISHNDLRQQNNLCTFREDMLTEGRGQGDQKSSSFEKQERNWPSGRGSISRF